MLVARMNLHSFCGIKTIIFFTFKALSVHSKVPPIENAMNAFIIFGWWWWQGWGDSIVCLGCNSDFIFLVTDLDRGTAGSEPLQSLFWSRIEC